VVRYWRLAAPAFVCTALACNAILGVEDVRLASDPQPGAKHDQVTPGQTSGGTDLPSPTTKPVSKDAGADTATGDAQPDANACLSVQQACGAGTPCCDPAVCDHIGGLVALSCCLSAGATCTTSNDCCGQLNCTNNTCAN
jgi:hypothetical protein